MAESEGFEPPIGLLLCLISSQVHSTGLCQLSDFISIAVERVSGNEANHIRIVEIEPIPHECTLFG